MRATTLSPLREIPTAGRFRLGWPRQWRRTGRARRDLGEDGATARRRRPGDESFYWLTLALASVWALGAFGSGPLHLGCVRFRGRNRRPVISGTVLGLPLGGAFLVGGLVAREIPGVREFVTRVLDFADHGSLALVVFITVINGVAEELFFRGGAPISSGVSSWYWHCRRCSGSSAGLTQRMR
jgi:hypothetical protein